MPTGALPDPLYHLARQHLLFSGDTRISPLQRWLRGIRTRPRPA